MNNISSIFEYGEERLCVKRAHNTILAGKANIILRDNSELPQKRIYIERKIMDIINSLLITPSVTILYFEYPIRICINERTSIIARITARNISIKLKLKTGELMLNILSQN
jgi:hypothetical protein